MKLPEEYNNLNNEQKRLIVNKIVEEYWNEDLLHFTWSHCSDEAIEFLFSYMFSDEEWRKLLLIQLDEKWQSLLEEIKDILNKISVIDLKNKELMSNVNDNEEITSIEKQFL